MTSPGMPMLFEGQEFLETGWFRDDVSLDWSKLKTHRGINRLYRDLLHLRRNLFGVTRGLTGRSVHLHHFNDQDKVIGFHRWDQGGARDDVVVIASFSNRDIETGLSHRFPARRHAGSSGSTRTGKATAPISTRWAIPAASIEARPEGLRRFSASAPGAHLPSYGLLIFSQDEAGPATGRAARRRSRMIALLPHPLHLHHPPAASGPSLKIPCEF